ncbi:siderophore-interacting protein [Dietzia sp.]|uniref:siderophore-interacting protein n=1 Tax=Dietzia sp. TaxID=1871616 RepID=UPI002FD90347
MSNIAITQSELGFVRAHVLRSERISPHVMRVTLGGGDLEQFVYQGFDQWFRLAIPVHGDDRFENLPGKFGIGGYLKFLTSPKGTRPVIRNYTIRNFRYEPAELDIDFVVHGTGGVAGPWAEAVEPGTDVAFIDQGCGWKDVPAANTLIVADESGMPAALGVLRDLPRDATGHAIIELFDPADAQDDSVAPNGIDVRWVFRDPDDAPGSDALAALRELDHGSSVCAFAVGESSLATGTRRHLVAAGVPKSNITFCGYWKRGKAASN